MEVHKYLFTVTSFSKVLAMILFIALPFLGFYLGMKYQKEIAQQTTSVTPTPTIDQNQTECSMDNDCQNGAKCMQIRPILANQPVHKVCVQPGQATPL